MAKRQSQGSPREIMDSPIVNDVAPDENYETAQPIPDAARAETEDWFIDALSKPVGHVEVKEHKEGYLQPGEYFEAAPGKRVQIFPDGLPPPNRSLYKQRMQITQAEKATFLRVLSETGHVTLSCRAVGRTKWGMYNARKNDERFAELWDAALEVSVVNLEDEARRRAMAGSDLLLIFMLKGLKRRVYGDKPPSVTLDANGRPTSLTISWDNEATDIPLQRVEREDGAKFLTGPQEQVIDAEFTVEVPDKEKPA